MQYPLLFAIRKNAVPHLTLLRHKATNQIIAICNIEIGEVDLAVYEELKLIDKAALKAIYKETLISVDQWNDRLAIAHQQRHSISFAYTLEEMWAMLPVLAQNNYFKAELKAKEARKFLGTWQSLECYASDSHISADDIPIFDLIQMAQTYGLLKEKPLAVKAIPVLAVAVGLYNYAIDWLQYRDIQEYFSVEIGYEHKTVVVNDCYNVIDFEEIETPYLTVKALGESVYPHTFYRHLNRISVLLNEKIKTENYREWLKNKRAEVEIPF